MIDRKKYLQLCQQNAIKENSAKVIYRGAEYYPIELTISFNEKGETRNCAILKDVKANSYVRARIESVYES